MTEPSFFTKEKKLVRVIHPANQAGNRASPAAFERIPKRGSSVKEDGLSVSCTDIESFETIFARLGVFRDEKNVVSTCELPIATYNAAANKAAPKFIKAAKGGGFVFENGGSDHPCYVCKPSKRMGDSHSEVMYLKFIGELQEKAIAQTLANKAVGKIKRTKLV